MKSAPFQRLALRLILCTSCAAFFPAKASTITWDGGGGTPAWELPLNWSGDVLPTDTDLASIGEAIIQLGSVQTIGGYASSSGGMLTIGNDASLSVGTDGLFNAGALQLSANGSSVFASLFASGESVTLSGGGSIQLMSTSGGIARIGTELLSSLVNQDNLIHGSGLITGNVDNRSLIVADDPTALLEVFSIQNKGILRADGGILRLSGMVSQSSFGIIEAINGSTVDLKNAEILGGVLSTTSGGLIETFNGAFLSNVTLSGDFQVRNGAWTGLGGIIQNNGTFHVGAGSSGDARLMTASSGITTLAGGGSVHLKSSGSSIARFGTDPGTSLMVNQDNVIHGSGYVGGNVDNRSLIVADDPTAPLEVVSIQNNGILRADGGVLRLSGMVSQSISGSIEAKNGSSVNLNDPMIVGGVLSTTSGGLIETFNGAFLSNVTLSGDFQVRNGARTWLEGTIQNNGTFHVGAGSSGDARLTTASSGITTLAGGGLVHLKSSGSSIARFGTDPGTSLMVNQDNVIHGSGIIEGNVDNRSLIVADDPTAPLEVFSIQNNGILRADGGILQLSGMVSQSSFGSIEAKNGSSVNLNDPMIVGGVLSTTSGGLIETFNGAYLSNVTLSGDFQVRDGARTWLEGIIQNNGTFRVGAGSSGDARLTTASSGITTLAGGGLVHLKSSGVSIARFGTDPGTSLMVNQDNVIHGSGIIKGNVDNRSLIVADDATAPLEVLSIQNNGILRADGGILRLSGMVSQSSSGSIEANNGSTVNLDSAMIVGGAVYSNPDGRIHVSNSSTVDGLIHIDGGALEINAPITAAELHLSGSAHLALNGTLTLAGNFSFDSTTPSLWDLAPGSEVVLTGGQGATEGLWDGWQKFEIGGHEYGIDPLTHTGSPIGFSNNFNFLTLRIGSGAHVSLVDFFDNSAGTPDALYVDTLVFEDSSSVLNLNGLNLYYNSLSGDSSQIVSSAVPEPGSAVFLASAALFFTAGRRRKM